MDAFALLVVKESGTSHKVMNWEHKLNDNSICADCMQDTYCQTPDGLY